MADGRNVAPVIIKKKKNVIEGGHHGGAWKVAYADFVTAMMAFFMLMWLLSATTEKQRKGIADYFSPVAPISRMSSGSDGMFAGDSVFAEDVLPQSGTGATSLHESSFDGAAPGMDPTAEAEAQKEAEAQNTVFEEVQEVLLGLRGESMLDDNWLRHMISRITDEGLVLEFYDLPYRSLFNKDGTPGVIMHELGFVVNEAMHYLNNDIAIEVHSAAAPLVQKHNRTRETTSERAFLTSEMIRNYGVPDERIRRLVAYGDREPVADNLMSVRNNRIEVVFLRY